MPSDRKPPKPVRAWAIACHDGSALHFGTVSVTRRDAWAKFDAEEWLARQMATPENKARLEMHSYNLRDGLVAEAEQKASDMAYKLGDLKIAVEEALKELREEHPAQRILEDAMKMANGE